MKKYIFYILSIFMVFALSSCGGGGGKPSLGGAPATSGSYQLKSNTLAFDPTNTSNPIIPLPNDIIVVQSQSARDMRSEDDDGLYFNPASTSDPATQVLYKALNKLQLDGLSPNSPIAIPLATDKVRLDPEELQANVKVIDADTFVGFVLQNYLNKYLQDGGSQDATCKAYTQNFDNDTLALGCFSNIMKYYYANSPAAYMDIIKGVSPYIYANVKVKQAGNSIVAYPLTPLNPGHQYIAVVLGGIKNLNPPTMFSMLIGDKSLVGTQYVQLEPVRQEYTAQIIPLLNLLGYTKDNILEFSTFQTANKTLSLKDYGQMSIDNISGITGYKYTDLDNMTYTGPLSPNEYLQIDGLSDLPLVCQNVYLEAQSLYGAHNPMKPVTDYTTYFKDLNVYALSNITPIVYDLKHNLIIDNSSGILTDCVKLFDNSTLYDNVTLVQYNPAGTKGLLIFQHGLGKDKSDAGIIANDSNFSDYHVFAMDLPWHGGRVRPNNMNNVPLPSASCDPTKSGSCYLTSNPIDDVMNIYQSLLDMHTLVKFVALMDYMQAKTNNISPLPIYFASQSMGSITGSMLLKIDNVTTSSFFKSAGLPTSNFITKADLNVGGAGYASILNEATNSEITNLLDSTGVKRGDINDYFHYWMTLYLFQLLLDPVDPAYMAHDPAIQNKVILQSANHDTLVPNISNEILANALGDKSYTPIPCNDTTLNIDSYLSPGWYMFGEGSNWVNHGFIIHTNISLYPEAAQYLNQACVDEAQRLARKQAADFFAYYNNPN